MHRLTFSAAKQTRGCAEPSDSIRRRRGSLCSPTHPASIFAFHIHSGGTCSGSADDPFRDAQGHYHPENCPHPAHAGDMPPLFSNKGYAAQAFLTGRFTVREIIGRTVIIHAGTDDFTSQPAGNAGARIACGVIRRPGCR